MYSLWNGEMRLDCAGAIRSLVAGLLKGTAINLGNDCGNSGFSLTFSAYPTRVGF